MKNIKDGREQRHYNNNNFGKVGRIVQQIYLTE